MYKKVALDWMVTESEDMEKGKPVFLQLTWTRSYMVSVSLFIKTGACVPGGLTYPFGRGGICFPPCNDFSLVSSCWNLITPFSNNVNVVKHCLSHLFREETHCCCLRSSYPRQNIRTSTEMRVDIPSRSSVLFVLKLWTEILEIFQKDHWILHWLRTTFLKSLK